GSDQHPFERWHERPEPRQRLGRATIAPLRRRARIARPHDLAHRVAGKPELARDRLDLPTLNEVRPTSPADRIHRDHPPTPLVRLTHRAPSSPTRGGVKLHADHPLTGV